ncbi:3791_t:CDS:2 [Ambispora gerdemannii]|uniref:3791_t:CDS:1 n=1 Tax=Ambispora gerdemannii TaxID=144530 RepID=A0A9N9FBN0_9GLOM|nr:3791_t:CDS:2 [Ambispora gerdemannii]
MSSKVASSFVGTPPFDSYYSDKLSELFPSIQWKSLTTEKYHISTEQVSGIYQEIV